MINAEAIKRLERCRAELGPHGNLLLREMLTALENEMPASVIILGVAVLDVALSEVSGTPHDADGMAQAAAGKSRDVWWLRTRRNGIVHYVGGQGGLMGGADDSLTEDANRAASILADALETLT